MSCAPEVLVDEDGYRFHTSCNLAGEPNTTDDHYCVGTRCYLPLERSWMCASSSTFPSTHDGRQVHVGCALLPAHRLQRQGVVSTHDLRTSLGPNAVCRSMPGSDLSECMTIAEARSDPRPPPSSSSPQGANATGGPQPPPPLSTGQTSGTSTSVDGESSAAEVAQLGEGMCSKMLASWKTDKGFVSTHFNRSTKTCHATYKKADPMSTCAASFPAWYTTPKRDPERENSFKTAAWSASLSTVPDMTHDERVIAVDAEWKASTSNPLHEGRTCVREPRGHQKSEGCSRTFETVLCPIRN